MAVCRGCRESSLAIDVESKRISRTVNYPCLVCLTLARIVGVEPKSSAFFCKKNCFTAHHRGRKHALNHYFPVLYLPLDERSSILKYLRKEDYVVLMLVSKQFMDDLFLPIPAKGKEPMSRTANLESSDENREDDDPILDQEQQNTNQSLVVPLRPGSLTPRRTGANTSPTGTGVGTGGLQSVLSKKSMFQRLQDRLAVKKPNGAASPTASSITTASSTTTSLSSSPTQSFLPVSSDPVKKKEEVSNYYTKFIADIDQVIEQSKNQKEIEIQFDHNLLALLQAKEPSDNKDNEAKLYEWETITAQPSSEPPVASETEPENEQKTDDRQMFIPVLLTPKLRIYEAYEEL